MSLTSGTCPWRSSSSTSSSAMKIGRPCGSLLRKAELPPLKRNGCDRSPSKLPQNDHPRRRRHLPRRRSLFFPYLWPSLSRFGLRSLFLLCRWPSLSRFGLRSLFLLCLWPTLCQHSRHRLRCSLERSLQACLSRRRIRRRRMRRIRRRACSSMQRLQRRRCRPRNCHRRPRKRQHRLRKPRRRRSHRI